MVRCGRAAMAAAAAEAQARLGWQRGLFCCAAGSGAGPSMELPSGTQVGEQRDEELGGARVQGEGAGCRSALVCLVCPSVLPWEPACARRWYGG